MDGFKAQFERVKQQLAALSSTQRMLVMSLAAVMALTLLYWGKYAGTPEVTPVVAGAMSDDELARADAALTAAGLTHSMASGRLMVPVDRRSDAYAALAMAGALPTDARPAGAETAADGDANPFASQTEQEARGVRQLQGLLGDAIRHFPGVSAAAVVVNAKQEYHVGGSLAPSAVVNITSKNTAGLADAKNIARAAAETVGRSVSGLTLDQVSVIINGRTVRFPGTAGDGSGFADDQHQQEDVYTSRLRDQLHYIRNVTVAVTCAVNAQSIESQKTEYDKPNLIATPVDVREHTINTTTTDARSGDVGFGPNTGGPGGGADVGSGGNGGGGGGGTVIPGGSTTEDTDTQTRTSVIVGTTVSKTNQAAGVISVKSVAIGVPHSYFLAAYHFLHPAAAKDVSDDTLDTFVKAECDRIAGTARHATGDPAGETLAVSMYPDLPDGDLPAAGTAGVAGVADGVVSQLMSGHVKEVAAGGLALVSLMMMLGIARKSNPAVTAFAGLPAGGTGDGDDPRDVLLASDEDVAGSAVAGDAPLDGMELDDEAIRSQQMLEQVSTLVKENPDAAAALVKRWVTRA